MLAKNRVSDNVGGVKHISSLGRISDPQLQLQLGQQSFEPACMPAGFRSHTHLLARQSTVEVLRLFVVD